MKRPFSVTPDERPAVTESEVRPWLDPEEVAQAIRRYKERAKREGLTLIAGLLEAKVEDADINRS